MAVRHEECSRGALMEPTLSTPWRRIVCGFPDECLLAAIGPESCDDRLRESMLSARAAGE